MNATGRYRRGEKCEQHRGAGARGEGREVITREEMHLAGRTDLIHPSGRERVLMPAGVYQQLFLFIRLSRVPRFILGFRGAVTGPSKKILRAASVVSNLTGNLTRVGTD